MATGARPGFFLGDGAGVGKGRQIAALVKDYWLARSGQHRRVLWVSVSADLRWVGWCGNIMVRAAALTAPAACCLKGCAACKSKRTWFTCCYHVHTATTSIIHALPVSPCSFNPEPIQLPFQLLLTWLARIFTQPLSCPAARFDARRDLEDIQAAAIPVVPKVWRCGPAVL